MKRVAVRDHVLNRMCMYGSFLSGQFSAGDFPGFLVFLVLERDCLYINETNRLSRSLLCERDIIPSICYTDRYKSVYTD